MVGANLIFRIDKRLRLFFNENLAFGGIPIIVFVDFCEHNTQDH